MKKIRTICRENFLLLFPLLVVVFFFLPLFSRFLLPIPSDTIVGLYHPFRDLYSKEYPNGIPFKNFLITDPVRQQLPWRNLAISVEKRGHLPLWNPYSFSGSPLLANFQSAPFYPLNIFLFFLPLPLAWSVLIVLEPFLAVVFMYAYLRKIQCGPFAAAIGALAFSFSGFSVAWMEWNTIMHVILWLPLMLMSIDKIFNNYHAGSLTLPNQNSILPSRIKQCLLWLVVFFFALVSSFFAGHLQTFFYVGMIVLVYFFVRWWQFKGGGMLLVIFAIVTLMFITVTSIQWLPTLQFISLSARSADQAEWTRAGWFIPWQHLIQFIIPDFYGNPTTLNYWGTWNYAELVGYFGFVPLFFSLFAIFFRRDKKTLFFSVIVFLSLLFSLSNPISHLPYTVQIPLLATAQPTRLLSIITFAGSILGALGLDYLLKVQLTKRARKQVIQLVVVFTILFALIWGTTFLGGNIFHIKPEAIVTSRRNILFPSLVFAIFAALLFFYFFLQTNRSKNIVTILILLLCAYDVIRFAQKFEPFTKQDYLFPNTKIINFLKNDKSIFRIASADSRILPPNFSTYYKIQSIEGYDPLYLRSYGEFIASSERNKPDISQPFGFNRIITPHNMESPFIDLLNVKYILSLTELDSDKFEKVLEEGLTKLYKNKSVLQRSFFVNHIQTIEKKDQILQAMFTLDLAKNAIIEANPQTDTPTNFLIGTANITEYSENKIKIHTKNAGDGFLVVTDIFYPIWKAYIDTKQTPVVLLKTDYTFRGLYVPKGEHDIVMYPTIF